MFQKRASLEEQSADNNVFYSQFFNKRSIDITMSTQPDTYSINDTLPDVNSSYHDKQARLLECQKQIHSHKYKSNLPWSQNISTQQKLNAKRHSLINYSAYDSSQHNFRDTSLNGASRELNKKTYQYLKVKNEYEQSSPNKIFIKTRDMLKLDTQQLEKSIQKQHFRIKMNKSAVTIQKWWRMIQQRRWYKHIRTTRDNAIEKIQSAWRHKKFERVVKALLIQHKNQASISVQRIMRGYLVRKAFEDKTVKVKLNENLKYFAKMRNKLVLDAQIKISYYARRYLKSLLLKRENASKVKLRNGRRQGKRVAEASLNRLAYGKQSANKEFMSSIIPLSLDASPQSKLRQQRGIAKATAVAKPGNNSSKSDIIKQQPNSRTGVLEDETAEFVIPQDSALGQRLAHILDHLNK